MNKRKKRITNRRKTSSGKRRSKRRAGNFKKFLFFIIICLILISAFYFLKNRDYPYHKEITKAASAEDLDPALVAAIVRQESNFNPQAKSRVGAMGLMQIMPLTWDEIAGMKGEENTENFYEVDKNLAYGCHYFAYLLKRFNGEVATALAAYNAGPTITSKWLSDPDYSRDGKKLYNIPYPETDNYVKKVLSYYEGYKNK